MLIAADSREHANSDSNITVSIGGGGGGGEGEGGDILLMTEMAGFTAMSCQVNKFTAELQCLKTLQYIL